MYALLTIVRYPKWLAWAGFLSMALFRLPFFFNKKVSFYKLLGCGKNGSFDKVPDVQQWGIIAVCNEAEGVTSAEELTIVYGNFIKAWWRFFKCTEWTVVLEAVEGHGKWDGKEVFGTLPRTSDYDGLIAVLTRATIRPSQLTQFWKHVAPSARNLTTTEGFITSVGIGEVPWIKQATFSIWKNKESLKTFAYKMREHTEVIRKTRQENWYSEDMFVRFKVLASIGTVNGKNPLQGIL